MKKSFATWRVGFASLPDREKVRRTASLLAPLARVEKAPDYANTAREQGLHDILFIEPEEELFASELAQAVLTRAHRLGKGWSIVWPAFAPRNQDGLTADEVRRAALPESLDGLSGCINRSFPMVEIFDLQMESVSFSVRVTEDARPAEAPPTPPVKPREESAPPAPGPDALAVMTALGRLLISYRTVSWKWDPAGAAGQIKAMGFTEGEEEWGARAFTAPDGTVCRVMAEGERVMWVEFVLSSSTDPHLLDENAFARKQDECESLFNQAVHYARALLGTPLFSGASGDKGFPRDQWADFAAVWQAPCGRLMMEQKHNDREMPLELCLVFAPPA